MTPDTRYSTRKLLPRFFLFSARMIDDQADMDLRWKIYAETMGAGVQRKGTQEQKNRLPAAGSKLFIWVRTGKQLHEAGRSVMRK